VGWLSGLLPLVGVAVLAAELARSAHRRRLAVARIRDLHEVSLAGQRIGDGTGDLTAVATQVFAECRRVVNFGWFQLDMREHDGSVRSWRARERGGLEEGAAEPERSPPALPGIHRRTGWRVLERELTDDRDLLARLRFWCDPRRLEPTSVELLDALLPQIVISVRQALTEREAKRDHLTGLPDRRVLEARLEEAYRTCRLDGSAMAVVMCDIDRFKRINDRHGHAAGDGALLEVAGVLESCRRESDLCARYGGEEFAVVLQRGDGETALAVAERIRQAVGSTVFVHEGRRIPLRISAGVAAYPELYVDSGKELLLLADEALYEAKRRGRDRCLLHLGRRRYRLPGGKVLGEEKAPPEPEVPTLFA
jgi:diguanylate cyclase (GGDEF)-like protein